jgi:hypothetical protein
MAATPAGVCTAGDSPNLERVRYFPGQLITPDDLTQEQDHQRARMRRHNRLLHGWGVVCGAWVDQPQGARSPSDSTVVVQPGAILGPYGDEIVIDADVEVDVLSEDLDGNAVPCGGAVDPWCAEVRVDRPSGQPLYLAVKYAECLTRPVRTAAGGCGCGCGDQECEYSRIRESFVVKVLTELPASYTPMPFPHGSFEEVLFCGGNPPGQRPCPPCPDDPWVILAAITLQGTTIASVDCLTHRRFVAAFGTYYYQCNPSVSAAAARLVPGDVTPDVTPEAG